MSRDVPVVPANRVHRCAPIGAAVLALALVLGGCAEIGPGGAEAKVGVGPFKAYSVEAGPGGVEEKGPSAGPIKLFR
jgi:hypothetical protein